MKRSKQDHLDDAELAALQKDLRAGLLTSFLAQKYRLTERSVQAHRAGIFGKRAAVRVRQAPPKKVPEGTKRPMPAPNCIPSVAHKLMAGRA